MPTCRHLMPQNQLPWQHPLTKVHQIASCSNFSINGVVNATIRIAIRPPVIEWQGRHLEEKNVMSRKHKPAGGIAMLGRLPMCKIVSNKY